MTPPTTDTSREAVERGIARVRKFPMAISEDWLVERLEALLSERDAAVAREKSLKDNTEELRQLRREFNAVKAERDALREQLAAAKDLPWRAKDIKRGLILFRTSSNAHGSINYQARSEKVDNLPQAAKDELAAIMVNMALGYSQEEVAANGVVKEWVAAARNEALEEAAQVASTACLVEPDGGSPTDEEVAVCVNAEEYIRAPKSATPVPHELTLPKDAQVSPATNPLPASCIHMTADMAENCPNCNPSPLFVSGRSVPMDTAPREVTVQEAYLAGFMAAGEGYNGEYPFQDNDTSPEGCDMWVKQRDEDLRALAQEGQSDV